MKRLISFILCVLLLLSLVPAAAFAESETDAEYDLPEAGDSVNILGTGKAEEAKIGGSSSTYNIHRDGEGYAHTVKFRKFAENNTKNYDPDIILYCIQFVKLDKSKYEVFKPAKHEYWQGLSEMAREGILLSIGLGYPASTLEELSSDSVTVTADDALAATQTLAWEFELGLRTTFEPFTADEIAAKKDTLFSGNYAKNPNVNGINATPAETAYNKILERIRAFKEEHPNTTLQELEDNPNFVLLAADDAQTLLSYRLPGDSLITWSERGAIEIHKTDTDGYPLAGAKFEILDENFNVPEALKSTDGILTTDENGYAFTGADILDYGKYYVSEIEAPEGYERITAPWTVTIGEDTPTIDGVRKVVIEAVNESVKISLTVNKVWNDADDQDGKRPDSITVKLLADGVEIDTAQLAADGWTHTFDALPKYRDGGIEISYSVLEVVPEGYTAEYDKDEGVVTITNTYTPATTSLTVNKVWNDANDQDGKRPDSITVKLLADGVEIDSAQLAADGWTHTFDALPKYRDGGIAILYSVLEVVPEGYTADYDVGEGIVTITNTYTPATTSLTVNKVWNDANDQDGKRPDSVTVKLLADGVEIDTAQLAADGWTHTFAALPKYRDGGVEISYSVLEVVPDGYTAEYDVAEGVVTITNTYTPATTSLTVNKVWNDANDQDGKRPDSVTVKLLADGVEIKSAELTADGWSFTFNGLPKYRDGGIEITYSVLEVVPDGYTASYDKGEGVVTITNTYTPATTSLTVNKVWNDANDQDGKRPDSITVKLLADGVEIKSAELTADGWSLTFNGLPKYRDGGIAILYSVVETVPDGYTAAYDVAEGVVTITNTYTPETTSLTVNKVWNDANDQDGKRPDSITVKLLADGVEIKSAELTADGWAHTFDALPKYRDGGIEIAYSVLEVVPDGYTAAYDVAEGVVTITNTYTPETTSLTVNKVWNDANDQDGKRPDSITVKLLADGVEIKSAELTADGWAHTFDALPKYRDGGIEIAYSVLEVVPDGYTASYDKGEGVVTITNTYAPETTSLTVNKVWNDANDQDGKRPDSITVKLLADGVEIDTAQLAAHGWAHTFAALPKYRDGGIEISYSVLEVVPDGYTASYDKGEGIVTITNTYTPELTSVNVTKTWYDDNDNDNIRPASVTIRLYADGVEIAVCELSAASDWSHLFSELPRYRDGGEEIVYTITEDPVTDYETVYDGYDVFNSHDPYRCDITVNKVWSDEDNVHGLRPDSVTVRLFADGVEIDSAVLSAENGWSVTFDGLLEFAYGSAIVYEIREDDVTYYSSRVEGSAEDGFTVVNTVEYVPPTGDGSSLAALGILAALSLAAPLALKRRRRSDA